MHRRPDGRSVAIAHDYLTQRGGAERVVLALARAFPGAPIYTTLYNADETYPEFADLEIITSPLNRISTFRRNHRLALPLLAPTASRLRIPEDVVVASTSGWAHGFAAQGTVVAYAHSPARWLYQRDAYLGDRGGRSAAGVALTALRPALVRWDRAAARKPAQYLCNSSVVRERIMDAYAIEAEVVPAPLPSLPSQPEPIAAVEDWAGDYHLLVSRLLPYKNVTVAIDAFRGRDEHLVVIGNGPLRGAIASDLPPNVRLLSDLTDAQMAWAYANSVALIAPSHEDYGLTPIEAAAFGRPTVALRAGGYLDTVLEGVSGVFFDAPSPSSIADAVDRSTRRTWDSEAIRAHNEAFSESSFRARMWAAIDGAQ